jgi:hypothetical protein
MRTNVGAPLKNPVRRSSRREEAQIVRGSSIDQSLVPSAAGEIDEELRVLFATLS